MENYSGCKYTKKSGENLAFREKFSTFAIVITRTDMTKRNYRLLTLLCALLFCCNMTSTAQHSARSKISPFVRTLAERENTSAKKDKSPFRE